ncbi:MAG: tetratricopeptide repeat protein [Desulfarculus sp.]|nr:tetratricopeptide repeat protein [Desulfarculus sp.]
MRRSLQRLLVLLAALLASALPHALAWGDDPGASTAPALTATATATPAAAPSNPESPAPTDRPAPRPVATPQAAQAASPAPSAPETPAAPPAAPESSSAPPAPPAPPAAPPAAETKPAPQAAPARQAAQPQPATQTAQAPPEPPAGPRLLWVELSVGGQPVQVKAGGVLALHPDAPFRVLKAKSDAWLDLGLSPSLAGLPTADPQRFNTLAGLLGEAIYSRQEVQLQVHKSGRLIGGVQLAIKLLPIDWLRRAEAATRLEDKIEATGKALELTPDDRLLALRMIDLLEEAKRPKEAAELLQRQAWARDDPALLARLLELYQRQGNMEAAVGVVNKLLALRPGDVSLLERLARLDEHLERWEEATVVLERLSQVVEEGERAPVLLRLAQVLMRAGKTEQALMVCQRAVELRPQEANAWRVLAEIREKAGDAAGTLEAQRRLAYLAPADLEAHLSLSEAYQKAGRKAEAAGELEKAALLRPGDSGLWLRLARLYEELEDRPALLQVYQRLTSVTPHDPNLDYNQGVLLLEMERYEPALESLGAAAQAKPHDREVARLVLEALLRLGRWDQALKQAQALLKDQPVQPALLERVYAGLAKERPQAVAALLDQALASGPKQGGLYQLRAALALDQDDTAAATKALELGVKNLPQDLALQLRLAGFYEAAGQDQKALQAYERILDKDPNFQDAQERYLQLKTSLLSERKGKPSPEGGAQ